MNVKTPTETVRLEYWNGVQWVPCGAFFNERNAWISLGGDDMDYRTLDSAGNVLTDKRRPTKDTVRR